MLVCREPIQLCKAQGWWNRQRELHIQLQCDWGWCFDGHTWINFLWGQVGDFLLMEDPSAKALASTIPKVTLRSQKTKSRLAKRRLWACSKLLKPTSWHILMPTKWNGIYCDSLVLCLNFISSSCVLYIYFFFVAIKKIQAWWYECL